MRKFIVAEVDEGLSDEDEQKILSVVRMTKGVVAADLTSDGADSHYFAITRAAVRIYEDALKEALASARHQFVRPFDGMIGPPPSNKLGLK